MTTTTAQGYTRTTSPISAKYLATMNFFSSNPKLCVINYYAYFLYLGNLYNVTALYIDCSRVRRRLSARSATAYYI